MENPKRTNRSTSSGRPIKIINTENEANHELQFSE